jgi:mono/diheme cytochrome c family protein
MISNQLIVCLGTTTLALSLFSAQGAGKTAVDLSKLPPASDKTGVTYATDIKPIFDKACITCHGAEKHKARLRLDGLEDVLKGGEDGRVVLPGNSAGSLLVHNIAFAGRKDGYMPPPRNKANIPPLTREQIGLIRAWIDQGAE